MTIQGESISATNAVSARKAGRTNAKLHVSGVVNPIFDWGDVIKKSLTRHSHCDAPSLVPIYW